MGITIVDEIYGPQLISEEVLCDLLLSAPLERLKGVHQSGAGYLVRPGRDVSRYEHSVGVMLCIRRLGGSLEEQIAGLLHDLSHTAFSHVADQVFNRRNEDFHELFFEKLVQASDIAEILASYGISSNILFSQADWPLLDQPQPELCADRIDYTLRDLFRLGVIDEQETQGFLSSLAVWEGIIVVKNIEAARWFVDRYETEVVDLFMNPTELAANELLARSLTRAIDSEVIGIDDLFQRDEDVFDKLRSSADPEIREPIGLLHPTLKATESDTEFDFRVFAKSRVIDPLVLSGDQAIRCGTMYPRVAEISQRVHKKAMTGIPVKLLGSRLGVVAQMSVTHQTPG